MSVVRAAVRRWVPAALVVSISVAFGVLAYAGHAPDVSRDQAVHGAVIALIFALTYTQCGPGNSGCLFD